MNRVSLVGMINIIVIATIAAAAAAADSQIALPGCPDHCGEVKVPYPFGTHQGCFLSEHFFIDCDQSLEPPKPFLGNRTNNVPVSNITPNGSELVIMAYAGKDCYNDDGEGKYRPGASLRLRDFSIATDRNKFTAVGCDTYATLKGYRGERKFITGCISSCDMIDSFNTDSCSGVGCCQTSIPNGLTNISVSLTSFNNHTYVYEFNPCSYAFVVEKGKFKFSNASFQELNNTEMLPMVLNWAIGNDTCNKAGKKRNNYACKGNSKCVNASNGSGYLCQCLKGYQGNPYHPDGCQDIDECNSTTSNPCGKNSICQNLPGNYNCICHKGFNKINGFNYCSKVSPQRSLLFIYGALGVGSGILGLIFLLTCAWSLHKFLMKRRKEKFFKLNGGLLLQQQLHSGEANIEKTNLFKSNELEKATDQYSPNRVLGQGGQGTVYQGMLADGKIVAVKKSKRVDQSKVAEFINEVVILSQINHRNVVKLLGCCLETQVPLLVYEFIPNGTLYQYIHHQKQDFPLTLKARLRIAAEIAAAISYLHSAASFPIYHRDIKSSNILLDEKYRAKIADFGTSRSISIEQTHLTTLVHGTFGYLDPEYFQSSQFTDKSDVYSFGVVLVELLTGQKPISTTRADEATSLAACFIVSMEENRLFDIVDVQVMMEGNKEAIMAVANLAKRCLDLSGKKRPSMKQVAMELERIQKPVKASNYDDQNFEESEYDQNEVASISGWSHSYNADASSSDFLPLVSFSH